MNKILFYAMRGEKMCFVHVLLNALDMDKKGYVVKIIFEGEAVKLPKILAEESNQLYLKCLEKGIIAGVCLACSKVMNVEEDIIKLGLPLLNDMSGHAGIKPYLLDGYEVLTF